VNNPPDVEGPSWLERISRALMREPQDRQQLLVLLRLAAERKLLDHDALAMIEGVLQVSEMQVRDILIPRTQMISVNEEQSLDDILSVVIRTRHSRFPVFNTEQEKIVGIIHAKDLVPHALTTDKPFVITDIMRPAVIVPESKRLDVLLKDFRANRNHMAIVVDEYGSVIGFVTIEDVLEQIVGEIADEFDFDEEDMIKEHSKTEFTVNALTPIEDFNQYFGTSFDDSNFDTIGGLVSQAFGHVPERGEETTFDGFTVKVLHATQRQIRLLRLTKVE